MMQWTAVDKDVLERCKRAIVRCEERRVAPMPWFSLLIRMHRELDRAGLLQKCVLKQEVCDGCIWEMEEGGCKQHFEGAHVDRTEGKVRFCPTKTTHEMRDHQLKQHKKRGRA